LTKQTDNSQLDEHPASEPSDDAATRVVEHGDHLEAADPDDAWSETDDQQWETQEEEQLPPRPRNCLLRPLPIALLVILIASLGFLAGVEVQKGSGGSSAAQNSFGAGGLPSSLSAKGGTAGSSASASSSSSGGLPAIGGRGGNSSAVTGTVSSVDGKTLYVKNSEGSVLQVNAGAGSKVTRTAKSEAKAIHPGDSVVVQGSRHGSRVKASSISATASGAQSAGLGALASGASSGAIKGAAVESLFGK
jgi:hypothetical protein